MAILKKYKICVEIYRSKREESERESMGMLYRVQASTTGSLAIGREQDEKPNYTELGAKGQILVGTITDVGDKISIDFDGTRVQVPGHSIKDAKEGEERAFEVQNVSKNGIVLKEVNKAFGQSGGNQIMVRTMVGNDKANFCDLLEKSGMSDENPVKGIEKSLKMVGNCMTAGDVRDMEQEGISVEKTDVDRVEKMLKRVKRQRREREEGVEKFKEGSEEQQREIIRISQKNKVDKLKRSLKSEQIAQRLVENNLPLTQENLNVVSNAMKMASVAPDLSEQGMQYMVANELEPTIGNVYQAQYAGSSRNNGAVGYGVGYQSAAVIYEGSVNSTADTNMEETWSLIETQVEDILVQAGENVDEESLGRAKWLFENDLPITKESLQQLQQLQQIKSEYQEDEILQRVVEGYAEGEAPETILLIPAQLEETKRSIEAFLGQLEEAKENERQHLGEQVTPDESISKIRQLEEARLLLTVRSAEQIKKQGIALDIGNLEKIVTSLREMEKNHYKQVLQEGNVECSEENISTLRDTQTMVQSIGEAPNYLLGRTLADRREITLVQLEEQGRSLKNKLASIGEKYETLMTKPSASLGDSLSKAFKHVPDILKDVGLEPTKENVRAVKILAYNQMEISEENLYQVKAYDGQVTQLLRELQPSVTIELMKRKINPLHMPIAQLAEQVKEIKKELGISKEQKYSKFLYQMEQQGEISQEDKKLFINIYKLLEQVQKVNGAAVGYVLQTGSEMNLKNLLTAVRTIQSGGVEEKSIEQEKDRSSVYKRKILDEQIDGGFRQVDAKEEYYQHLVEKIYQEVTPTVLKECVKLEEEHVQDEQKIYNTPLEKVLEKLQETGEEESYEYEEIILKQIKDEADTNSRAISFLEEQGIETTIENILAAGRLHGIYHQVREQERKYQKKDRERQKLSLDELAENLEDEARLGVQYENTLQKVEEMVQVGMDEDEVTAEQMESLRGISSQVQLMRQLAKRRDYQIPIVTEGSITNIHLTILPGNEEQGRAEISIQSEKYGKVTAQLRIQDGMVSGVVRCDSMKVMEEFSEEVQDFEQRIQALGMELAGMTYGLRSKGMEASLRIEQEKTDGTVPQLYKMSKAFVEHVSHLEQMAS